MTPSPDHVLRLGLRLARQVPVHPLREKVPIIPKSAGGNGLHDATQDEARIREWVARWPGITGWGIPTGSATGFDVLDTDGPEGEESLAAYVAKYGSLPETFTVQTTRGLHRWFRHRPGLRNKARVLPGVDVLTEGGSIIAPGSFVAGRERVVVVRASIAPWPEDLYRLCAPPPAPPRTQPPKPIGDLEGYAKVALDRELSLVAGTGPGGRNHQLNRSAYSLGQLHGAGVLPDVLEDIVSAALQAGLSEREARVTASRGWRAGLANPRDLRGVRAMARGKVRAS